MIYHQIWGTHGYRSCTITLQARMCLGVNFARSNINNLFTPTSTGFVLKSSWNFRCTTGIRPDLHEKNCLQYFNMLQYLAIKARPKQGAPGALLSMPSHLRSPKQQERCVAGSLILRQHRAGYLLRSQFIKQFVSASARWSSLDFDKGATSLLSSSLFLCVECQTLEVPAESGNPPRPSSSSRASACGWARMDSNTCQKWMPA